MTSQKALVDNLAEISKDVNGNVLKRLDYEIMLNFRTSSKSFPDTPKAIK